MVEYQDVLERRLQRPLDASDQQLPRVGVPAAEPDISSLGQLTAAGKLPELRRFRLRWAYTRRLSAATSAAGC